jgi:hypothetical protein
VATQLYGVAESLSHVTAAPNPSGGGGKGGNAQKGGGMAPTGSKWWVPDALRHRDREVEEMRRALKRQQQLVSDAHRQLLELSTRRRPLGAAGAAPDDLGELRAALAEQEMRRLMAEARADELQAQVRLFEEQGLRLRLHPTPLPPHSQQQDQPGARPGARRGGPLSPSSTPMPTAAQHLFTPSN